MNSVIITDPQWIAKVFGALVNRIQELQEKKQINEQRKKDVLYGQLMLQEFKSFINEFEMWRSLSEENCALLLSIL
jgi:hypothetical protein